MTVVVNFIGRLKVMDCFERRRMILEMVQQEPFVTMKQVQQKLGISPASVRRDFTDLADRGLVVRSHGRIQRVDGAHMLGMLPFSRRQVENAGAKDRIAKAASELLAPGDIVIIDGGTTTAHLSRYLPPMVRVITNSVPLASVLNEPSSNRVPMPEVNMTGGFLYPRGEILLGPHTIMILREYRANWALLGTSGLSPEGVLNSNDLVMETQREMMLRAQKVAILADHAKMEQVGMVKVCGWEDIDVLVTDQRPPAAIEEALREADVRLLIAH